MSYVVEVLNESVIVFILSELCLFPSF